MTHQRSFGLACRRDPVGRMSVAHSHDDLEFNASDVDLEYLLDGGPLFVPAGSLAVFWAGRPHQLITGARGHDLTWLTVPLADAVGWRLPDDFVARMLSGEVAIVAARGPFDLTRRAATWSAELAPGHALHDAAAREVEALVLRTASAAAASPPARRPRSGLRSDVAAMAEWIAEHAAEDVTVADVAAHVHLHPHYAMTLFREALGVTIGEYLAQCRIGRAKHLLLTTDRSIAAIAHDSGFGSMSQFYARFQRQTGRAPAAFRRRMTS